MLLAAVLASMSTGAYAVNPTGSIDVDAGATETVTSIGTSGSASCITKLGEGTAVLDSSLTSVNSTIRVMEGTLKIGDADAVSPSTVAISTNYGTYYEVLTVGGKDATLILNNVNVKTSDACVTVGGGDGNGTLIVENGSNADFGGTNNFILGDVVGGYYSEAADIDFVGTNAGKTDGSGNTLSHGVVTVRGGSSLTTSYGNFWMGDGVVNVEDNSKFYMGGIYGAKGWLGMHKNSTSQINISGGSQMIVQTPSFCSNYQDNTTVEFNVTGKGSALIVEEKGLNGKAVSADFNCMWGDNSMTSINVTDGAEVDLRCQSTALGSSRKPNEKVNVNVDADSSMKAVKVYSYEGATIKNAGEITLKSLSFSGGAIDNTGTINITDSLFIFGKSTMAITLNPENMKNAVISMGEDSVLYVGDDVTLDITLTSNVQSGSKFRILSGDFDNELFEAGVTLNVEGAVLESDAEGNVYLTFGSDVLIYRNPLSDAVQAANWGVFKSSQAFVGTLWGARNNAVVIDAPVPGGKAGLKPTAATGQTIAWGSVYSIDSHQGCSGSFSGADYSIYGAAIGAERQYVSGRSLGVAFGYDWGKASPFSTSRVDQNSWHAALYGRAGDWKVGQKGSVALDWSAAVGNTTSEHSQLGSDWSQDSMQLDARATYSYSLNDRTAVSAFAGVQYYAQGDDSTARVKADSLQNLRLQAGAGISYRATNRTTVYGELAIHNDTMRHNPSVELDGFYYGSGANPGRLGGSVTVGAQYQLNADWSLNGSYSYEGTDNSGEHNVNVGAVYSF